MASCPTMKAIAINKQSASWLASLLSGSSRGKVAMETPNACTKQKATIEQGPYNVGLTVSFCSRPFLLFKKAASSNRHHKRSVHDGSQSTSISSDCFKKPAKPFTKILRSYAPFRSSKPLPVLPYAMQDSTPMLLELSNLLRKTCIYIILSADKSSTHTP